MSDTFTAQLLTEKLTGLSNTQQSIETLSAWCIFHRKKYRQIAGTWRKLFKSSSEAHKIVLLYLANDILQNSKRNGTEFITEFWKFLPGDLKSACQSNDLRVKSSITRLVGIWDERKVFGSRGHSLKEDVLGKASQPVNDRKSPNPVRAVRNANSVKVKVTVGGRPEKIAVAYQSVLDEHLNEDAALNTCKAVVLHMGKMEKDVDGACTQGIPHGSPLLSEVMEQEAFLKQCVQQLESVEAKRGDLIVQLKEALQEQESKQELIQNQLQIAQAETERTLYMKEKIESAMIAAAKQSPAANLTNTNLSAETAMIIEPNAPPRPFINPPLPLEPRISFQNSSSAPQPQMLQPLGHSVDSFSSPPPLPSEPMTSFVNSTSAPPPLPSEPMPSFVSSLNSSPPLPSEPVTSFVNSLSAAPPLPLKPITSVMGSLSVPPLLPSQSMTSFLNSLSAPPPQSSHQLMPCTNFSAAPPQPSLALTSYTNSSTQHQQPSPPHPATSFSPTFSSPPPQPSQPVTSFAGLSAEDQQRKEAVAAMAAKLAASTSSAFVLSSVISSLAAEEAASKNGGSQSPGRFTGSPPNKRAKLEKPMSVSGTSNTLFNLQPPQLPQHPQVSMNVPQVSQANCQTLQPPLPLEPPPPRQPFMQTNGPMSGMTPYSFGGNPSPPVPLQVPQHLPMGQGSPAAPQPPLPPLPLPQHLQKQQQQQQLQQRQQQQWQQQQQQQSSNASGFFQPPGNAFYGQVQTPSPSTGAVDS